MGKSVSPPAVRKKSNTPDSASVPVPNAAETSSGYSVPSSVSTISSIVVVRPAGAAGSSAM